MDKSDRPKTAPSIGLWAELRRRKVVRTSLAYLAASWLLLQVLDVVAPVLRLPDWSLRLVLFLLAAGLPVVVLLSWAFELTPDGIKTTRQAREEFGAAQHGTEIQRRRNILAYASGIAGAVLLIVVSFAAGLLWSQWRPESHQAETPATPIEPVMVNIKGSCFQMGSPETELGREDDESIHEVCVDDFRIGQYEVSVREFERFVSSSEPKESLAGCDIYIEDDMYPDAESNWQSPGFVQTPDDPVVCVGWNNAMEYIEWLNQLTGRSYRLPTEAEWEYAARGGTQSSAFWGDDPNSACDYGNVADDSLVKAHPIWIENEWEVFDCDDGVVETAVVTSPKFRANPYGLYQVFGNVWELTCSAYGPYDNARETSCVSGPHRIVIRGGAWSWYVARAADRQWTTQVSRLSMLGFRLAHDSE